jgi:hypothetical protein
MNSSAEQIAIVIYSGMGLFALWVILQLWRGYMTDKLREGLFSLRAELFDYARNGAVSFDNRSYRGLWNLINSLIRFAHEISFMRLLTTIALEKVRPCFRTLPDFNDAIRTDANLTNEAKERLFSFHGSLFKMVFEQIICTSFAALPFLTLYRFYGILRYGKTKRPMNTPPSRNSEVLFDDPRLNHHIRVIEQQAVETRKRDTDQLVTA